MDPELIDAWLAHHGLGGLPVTLLPDTGFVNWVYAVGEDLVLRVSKNQDGETDCYTEKVAVPVAIAAGVATPALLHFDDGRQFVPGIATLYGRAKGVPLGRQYVDQRELPPLYRELGCEVALLHENVKEAPDPNRYLDVSRVFDARAELDRARSNQKVEALTYEWLAKWLDRLECSLRAEPDPVFLHNDLHSFNTMVHLGPLRYSAILDWGDAAWGDRILDFAAIPVWAVDWMLDGYRAGHGEVDEDFKGRLLWHDIGAALDATTDPWVETSEPWQPLTTSRWINLIRLCSADESRSWKQWLPESF